MRTALRQSQRTQQTLEVVTIPAPTGGLNTRDSILAMRPTDARLLVNAIARPGEVEIREGAEDWLTGLTGKTVETLMSYVPASGSGKLFAAVDNAIYDATTQGAVGAAVVSSLTNGRWQHVNFANSADLWLIAVNGADDMRVYNGSSWSSTAAFTGSAVNTNTLIDVCVYQKRLFFLKKDSRLVYYLAAGAISGAAALLNFEQLMKRGGKIQALGTWTVDAGDGLDDLFVAITSEGEAIVYSGIDPSVADDWRLKGVYYVGRPVGTRCLFKVGSELVVLTDRGLYPMSRALSESAVKREGFISDKINNEFFKLAQEYSSTFGWQAEISTTDNLAIVNVPKTNGSAQLVMELSTYGWSYFTGWDASCLHFYAGDVYYGTDGKVVKCLTGHDDFGERIYSYISPAYLAFGSLGQQKHVKMLRPLFVSDQPFSYRIAVSVDLALDQIFSTVISSGNWAIPYWDTAQWDDAVWGGQLLTETWHTVAAEPGTFLAVYLKIQKKGAGIKMIAMDYAVQRGGVL